jgi:alkylated DNA repair dioxygenase AlkB
MTVMATPQLGLFAEKLLPEGFRYQPEVISTEMEEHLVAHIRTLPLREFEFHGHTGKRRVLSFGWRYDFSKRRVEQADNIPDFLLEVRPLAATFAGISTEKLVHALVIEYAPGAAIGWHKDKPEFGDVIGLSLLAPCPFRLRRKSGDRWERVTLTVEPHSAYLLRGEARHAWEHSIPPVEELRYSITFRTMAERAE